MKRWRLAHGMLLVLAGLLLAPPAIWAQSETSGTIAGVVKDASGAVLPGATVEAASPALIEKARTVVTDSQGNYKIVDLRPGTYTVTVSLTGFGPVKRDGLQLTTGFTATVNAELKIGGVAETITVTGASPIVDIQNVKTQNVLSRDVLDTVPTGKTIQAFQALTLGATSTGIGVQDVGGNQGESAASISIHNSRGNDMKLLNDGMNYNFVGGASGGNLRIWFLNQVGVQEEVVATAGGSAETETGGVQLNAVPKDGGNTFKLYANGAFTNDKFQTTNLTSTLTSRGVTSLPSVKRIYDAGIGIGGPIKQDRLWFYSANRWWGAQEIEPGAFYNLNQGHYVGAPNSGVTLYAPDPSRPGFTDRPNKDFGVRLTWQATSKQRFSFSENVQWACNCYQNTSIVVAPDASYEQHYGASNYPRGTWTNPITSRLLVDAGLAFGYWTLNILSGQGVAPTDIGIANIATGLKYNAIGQSAPAPATTVSVGSLRSRPLDGRAAVSYVTGSHAFKAGTQFRLGWHEQTYDVNNGMVYVFNGATPLSITQFAVPGRDAERIQNIGLFGQDQWTLKRLTLNLGVRFDYIHGSADAERLPAGLFVGVRDFQKVDDLPNWKDITPRLGASYDVFGNGKTALKGSIGKYMQSMGVAIASTGSPALALVAGATRTWTDANHNYVPDCVLTSTQLNGECGALDNQAFGTSVPVTFLDPAWTNGWGNRPYVWQGTLSLQQELRPGLGLNVGYFRTSYGNFTVTVNQAVTASDFTSYCVTAPVDPRLPGGGGNAICGNYNVNPDKFGQVHNFITNADHYGSDTEVFNGFDIALNGRFGKRGTVAGGVSTGRTVTDICAFSNLPQLTPLTPTLDAPFNQATSGYAAANLPRNPAFCHAVTPWSAQTQVKLNAVYPLPLNFQVSGTFQNLPGFPDFANVVYTNAQVAPALGRNLAAGAAGTVTIPVLLPQTMFEDRINQVDLRFTKTFEFGQTRLKANLDVYNLFNTSSILGVNSSFGAAWLRPSAIMGARLFKVGGQIDF